MTQSTYSSTYYTSHELAFLRDLYERDREGYAKYAALIRCGMRAYDSTVDRRVVLAELARLEAASC